jgi:FAD/FMN-containing dehydrogenase
VNEERAVSRSGWGRFPRVRGTLIEPGSAEEARALVAGPGGSLIAQGLGRSYGDSALGARMLSTVGLDGIESLDEATGLLLAEAGTSLARILDHAVPRGWFLPVVPGTREVTLGGAIASDVHGKNHHRAGSFGRHVAWLDLLVAEGGVVRCSRSEEPELFGATCGGMGLTGVILRAAVSMLPIETAMIRQETLVAGDLDEAFELFRASSDWTYSMAWIDCRSRRGLGRAILFRGEHLTRAELPERARGGDALARRRSLTLSVPVSPPGFLLNALTIRAFNEAYFRLQRRRAGASVVGMDPFFFPLDGVRHWNRLYGRGGFIQHQSVVPIGEGTRPVQGLLEDARRAGHGSFLAVLKLFGPGTGGLSFPVEGLTLALDFPLRGDVLALADRMDRRVVEAGGRIYLTKDARMSADTFRAGYQDHATFLGVRGRWDPGRHFESSQSRRLGL